MYLNEILFPMYPCPTCALSLSLYRPLSLSFSLCSQKDFKSTRNIWGFSALFLAPSFHPTSSPFFFSNFFIPKFQTRVLSIFQLPRLPLINAVTASRRCVPCASFHTKAYRKRTPFNQGSWDTWMTQVGIPSACRFLLPHSHMGAFFFVKSVKYR